MRQGEGLLRLLTFPTFNFGIFKSNHQGITKNPLSTVLLLRKSESRIYCPTFMAQWVIFFCFFPLSKDSTHNNQGHPGLFLFIAKNIFWGLSFFQRKAISALFQVTYYIHDYINTCMPINLSTTSFENWKPCQLSNEKNVTFFGLFSRHLISLRKSQLPLLFKDFHSLSFLRQ